MRTVLLACLLLVVAIASGGVPQRWAVAMDFVEELGSGKTTGALLPNAVNETVGGISRPCIFQHPALKETDIPVSLRFEGVKLPRLAPGERLFLRLDTAMSARVDRKGHPEVDGVTFLLTVDGREVLRRDQSDAAWRPFEVDLSDLAGGTVTVEFRTLPRANSSSDWALWGAPRIEIQGRKPVPRTGPAPAYLQYSQLSRIAVPNREVQRTTTNAGVSAVQVLDEHLDLPTQLARTAPEAGTPRVPLAPAMAVGEGDDPANHTMVRVLNRYQIAELQFLAFPPTVRGGVSVNCLVQRDGSSVLVTSPISDGSVRQIRIYSRAGLLLRTISPSAPITAPYVVATGAFLGSASGDLIAVVSRNPSSTEKVITLLRPDGSQAGSLPLPITVGPGMGLAPRRSPGGASLLVWRADGTEAAEVAQGQPVRRVSPPSGCALTGAYPMADGRIALSVEDGTLSRLYAADAAGGEWMDIGRAENTFWYQWYRPAPEGQYVRRSDFLHLRTDGMSPAARSPQFESADPEAWGGKAVERSFEQAGRLAGYDSNRPALWEPCFTHRWMKGVFQAWRDALDRVTGLPLYTMLSRNNRPAEYGEFGNIDFYAGTYATGLPAVDRLYVLPLRAALRRLATEYRRNAEHFAGLEPNHEHEIAVEADGSMGDYNPRMIAGFWDYLQRRYGGNSASIRRRFGIPPSASFDAPRRWGRGSWDTYDGANPLFREWIAYNRYVVNYRLAQTYREALLAGFPPEIVKSHQIPDTYAIGNLSAFSTATNRYTPIDYALTAGVGYGFTRYGVWYRAPHDALQDSHSSGFDNISIGEYQALTGDAGAASGQLKYMFEHGVSSVHCMLWPEEYDKGFNDTMGAAIADLVANDRPRPGVTGGVGQVRQVSIGGATLDVACVGTGPARTGLLKSLGADGTREGSVYVTPFHSHVEVTALPTPTSARIGPAGLALGTLKELDSGHQVEVALRARATAPGTRLVLQWSKDGTPLPGLACRVTIGPKATQVRLTLRAQLPQDGVSLRLYSTAPTTVTDLHAYHEVDCAARVARGQLQPRRHSGAVTFDILPSKEP